jgi:hypothetical protein
MREAISPLGSRPQRPLSCTRRLCRCCSRRWRSGRLGVHLPFFLHISSAPDQANNFLALAFGVFVSGLTIFGSIMIMAHLNHNMMPMDELMKMQR